jgi:hypothetical protein
MKSSAPSDLPLSCRFTRWWRALAGNSTPRVTRHLATCACCREHFAANHALENRLRSAAATRTADVPSGFETRLSRAVQVAIRETPAESSGPSFGFWAFLGSVGVGAAVIAVIFLNAPQPEAPQGPIQLVEEQTESPAPARSLASNLPSSDALVRTIAQDPLQEEIELVYADARAALQFLARNFLPEDTATAQPADGSGTTS